MVLEIPDMMTAHMKYILEKSIRKREPEFHCPNIEVRHGLLTQPPPSLPLSQPADAGGMVTGPRPALIIQKSIPWVKLPHVHQFGSSAMSRHI